MRGFKRTVSLLIVICVMITCCSVNTNTVEAAAIAVKKGSEISEIKINETTQKVTAKEINHKAGWYKKSGVSIILIRIKRRHLINGRIRLFISGKTVVLKNIMASVS